ncbi:MAG: ABC transporter ATP-binding protein [Candidatus Saccharimonadales bacterium]
MTNLISIDATQLTVQKKKTVILHKLDFTVRAGTITGLIGPSGSGKTTLMRAIVGVQRIKSGELTVLGYAAGSPQLRPKIGYVTQSPAIYGDLSVLHNVAYFAKLVRASPTQVNEIIQTVHLADKKDQLVESLSGGQKARVSLAIALLGNPDLLVLDEPTVGLDPILRQELWQLFSELAAAGKTVIISSHVMDEAERCDELLLMREGNLLWNDTRQKLLSHTNTSSVEAAFITMVSSGKVV